MSSNNLGNPAPVGLLAFGTTTLMLMYVEMGWVEAETTGLLVGYAFFYGGLGQVLVGIFEIIKGSSFSFAVFVSYGFFWMGWSLNFLESHHNYSTLGKFSYQKGQTAFYIQWAVLTMCFWVITWRKNIALIAIFTCLTTAFYLLAIAAARGNAGVTKAAGYFGFFAALGAFYTGIAELVNEEYGRNILPGLTPIAQPERTEISMDSIMKLIDYDDNTNTMILYFRGLQITNSQAVQVIKEAVEKSILDAKTPDNKVHVVVDYKNVLVSKPIQKEYWEMAYNLEQKYYLSVRRFAISSFGTPNLAPAPNTEYLGCGV